MRALIAALVLVSIAVTVSGKGAWNNGKEYTYKVKIYTKTDEKKDATVGQANLKIVPESDNLLVGKISNGVYGKTDRRFSVDDSDLIESMSDFGSWKLNNKRFKIHLENGVIRSLSVDSSVPSNEVNQLKAILSQLQVNTKKQRSADSNRSDFAAEESSTSFKVVEPTVFGNCETSYDISPLPDYLLRSKSELTSVNTDADVFQIEKTRNLRNCMSRSGEEQKQLVGKFFATAAPRTRILISGDMNDYKILSVIASSPPENDYLEFVGLKLESYSDRRDTNENWDETTFNRHELAIDRSETRRSQSFTDLANLGRCTPAENAEERDTRTCWTGFVEADAACKNDFGPEWTSIGSAGCCGFLCLGFSYHCRRSFPGCTETVCYSSVWNGDDQCVDQFKGGDLPISCGGTTNCSPGFRRVRCCPQSYGQGI